jgi:hypothetical protein
MRLWRNNEALDFFQENQDTRLTEETVPERLVISSEQNAYLFLIDNDALDFFLEK